MKKSLLIIFGVVLVLGFVSVALFLFQGSQNNTTQKKQISSDEPSKEITSINGWKVFESKLNNFRVEHPAGWRAEETDEGVVFTTPQYNEPSVYIRVLRDTYKLDALQQLGFEQWQGRFYIKGRKDDFRAQAFFTSINGKRAIVAPPVSIYERDLNRYITYPIKSVVLLESDRYALFDMEMREEAFDTMLGTFTFLPRAIDTSDWEVYENEQHGFRVSHPSNFNVEFNDQVTSTYYKPEFSLLIFDSARDPARGYIPPKVAKDGYRFSFFNGEQVIKLLEEAKSRAENPPSAVARIERLPVQILGGIRELLLIESLRTATDERSAEVYFPWQNGWIFASTVNYDKEIFLKVLSLFEAL